MSLASNLYPYTDFHEMNLDWILGEICKLHKDMNEFEVINQIKWKGTWNISKQYPIWSIVDNGNGFGYISIKNVPAGIELDNEEYWRLTSNYSALYADMQNRILALESKSFPGYIFETINDMVQSDKDFTVGDVIVVCNPEGCWKVTEDSIQPDLTRKLLNNKYAELLPTAEGYYNLNSLDIPTNTDLYNILNYLINAGHLNIYIPKGTYRLSDTLIIGNSVDMSPHFNIIGAGREDTMIICSRGFIKVNLKGYLTVGSTLSNMTVRGDNSQYLGGSYIGLEVASVGATAADLFDNMHINNICFRYFQQGIRIVARSIWNYFENVLIQYCNLGFVYSCNTDYGFFNQNTFINCQFDTNERQGLYIAAKKGYSMGNNFVGCSIEGNYSTGSTVGNLCEAELQNTVINFIGCHFENASPLAESRPILTVEAMAVFNGCAFIGYPNYLYTGIGASAIIFNQPTLYNSAEAKYGGDIDAVFNNKYIM